MSEPVIVVHEIGAARPCRFCESTAVVMTRVERERQGYTNIGSPYKLFAYAAECTVCHARGPVFGEGIRPRKIQLAFEAWQQLNPENIRRLVGQTPIEAIQSESRFNRDVGQPVVVEYVEGAELTVEPSTEEDAPTVPAPGQIWRTMGGATLYLHATDDPNVLQIWVNERQKEGWTETVEEFTSVAAESMRTYVGKWKTP